MILMIEKTIMTGVKMIVIIIMIIIIIKVIIIHDNFIDNKNRITNLMVVILPRLTSCYLVSLEIEAGADPYIPRNLFILDTRTRGFNSTLDRRMGLIIY